jgi:hypothetical protein
MAKKSAANPAVAFAHLNRQIPPEPHTAIYSRWQRKVPPPPPITLPEGLAGRKLENWHWLGHQVKDSVVTNGHGPGSQICFTDQIHGTSILELKPGQPVPAFDEIQFLKQWKPEVDWEGMMTQREADESAARRGE